MMISRNNSLEGVEAQPVEYGIVSKWDSDHKEGEGLSHLAGLFSIVTKRAITPSIYTKFLVNPISEALIGCN